MAGGPDDRRAMEGQARCSVVLTMRLSSGRNQNMLRTRETPSSLQTGRDGPAIEARGLVMRYGDREVLHGIDLVVPHGMVVGFLGPNGAGKTTTFYMVVGLARPDSGQVFLGEDDITALPMYQRAWTRPPAAGSCGSGSASCSRRPATTRT
jgi:ABC-type multidrug transport system fused ATPase/permease subunit